MNLRGSRKHTGKMKGEKEKRYNYILILKSLNLKNKNHSMDNIS